MILVYSNADWAFSNYLYISFYTDNVPASATYTVKLYDKYYSGSNYGLAVAVSGSISRTASGYSTVPATSIRWRRTTFKQIRTDAGPLKIIFNNNYNYVSTYSMTSNSEVVSSDGIVISLPVTVAGGTTYYCFAREFPANQYSLYKEYVVNCAYYSTTQVLIKSIPSHIMKPNFYYEFIVYRNGGSGSSLLSVSSSSSYVLQVWTVDAYDNSGTTLYHSNVPYLNPLNVYPITLNRIYILTREAAAVNSLYVDFNIAFAVNSATTVFYLEFIFDSLDLNYFGITNGGAIPCLLVGFSTLSGKQRAPTCYGYADGVNATTPLRIRVFKISGFSANTNFKIAFDNFNNPPINTLILTPINMRVNLVDRTNTRVYTSYFPNIYYSDSINTAVPANLGGSIGISNNNRGASTNHHMFIADWPYNSNSADVSQKIVLKIAGGITCCQSFNSLTLTDSQTGYTLLWSNPNANTSVYETPSKGINTDTYWYINNVVNPNQVSFQTYNQLRETTFIMYVSYKTTYISKLNQPAFSSYASVSDFVVSSSPTITESNAHFSYHS